MYCKTYSLRIKVDETAIRVVGRAKGRHKKIRLSV